MHGFWIQSAGIWLISRSFGDDNEFGDIIKTSVRLYLVRVDIFGGSIVEEQNFLCDENVVVDVLCTMWTAFEAGWML